MDKVNFMNQIKSPTIIKDDLFTDYLNCNNFQSNLFNEEFIKPNNETFDKFFNNDESSFKSLNSINDYQKSNLNKSQFSEAQSTDRFQQNNNLINNRFINGGIEKNINEENNFLNDNNNSLNISINLKKKNLFSTLPNNEINEEDMKQKKLLMNRESAKKSRLKKKRYIENLEKQYIILKEEFIKIKENQRMNNYFHEDKQPITKEKQYMIKNQDIPNNINLNLRVGKENEIIDLKNEEKNIISNNLDKDTNIINNYFQKQKKLLGSLLVNQIDFMTPISIKAFQTKFLKMQILDVDDSIEVIKNKVNMNLHTIMELYGIENEDNETSNINIGNKKKSMAYQLYDFYKNIKLFVDKFVLIYSNIESI